MTNAPLPIPVEHLISAADLDPSPADLMMAAGGVSFESPTDAATTYPNLWKSRQAVADAWRRFKEGHTSSFRNREYLIMETLRVQYQKAGARQRPSVACVDPAINPDPQTWLAERLGPLAYFSADA
jgi:hypothetical protein